MEFNGTGFGELPLAVGLWEGVVMKTPGSPVLYRVPLCRDTSLSLTPIFGEDTFVYSSRVHGAAVPPARAAIWGTLRLS